MESPLTLRPNSRTQSRAFAPLWEGQAGPGWLGWFLTTLPPALAPGPGPGPDLLPTAGPARAVARPPSDQTPRTDPRELLVEGAPRDRGGQVQPYEQHCTPGGVASQATQGQSPGPGPGPLQPAAPAHDPSRPICHQTLVPAKQNRRCPTHDTQHPRPERRPLGLPSQGAGPGSPLPTD